MLVDQKGRNKELCTSLHDRTNRIEGGLGLPKVVQHSKKEDNIEGTPILWIQPIGISQAIFHRASENGSRHIKTGMCCRHKIHRHNISTPFFEDKGKVSIRAADIQGSLAFEILGKPEFLKHREFFPVRIITGRNDSGRKFNLVPPSWMGRNQSADLFRIGDPVFFSHHQQLISLKNPARSSAVEFPPTDLPYALESL